MRPEFVVVSDVLSQDPAEVLFAEHDDVVGALASERADYPLDDGVRLRCAHGSLDGLDPDLRRPRREVAAVAAVPIANEEARCCSPGRGLDDLPPDPVCRRMSGDVEMHDPAPVVGDGDEYVQGPEGQGGNGEEVCRPNLVGVQAKKGPPAW